MVSRSLFNSERFKCIPFFLFAFKRFSPAKFDVVDPEFGPFGTFGPNVPNGPYCRAIQVNLRFVPMARGGCGSVPVSRGGRTSGAGPGSPLHRSTCAPAAPPPVMRADLHAEERGPSLRTLLFLHVGNTPPTRHSTPVCPGEEALSQGRPNLPVPRNQTGGICVFSRSHLNFLFIFFWRGGGDFAEL